MTYTINWLRNRFNQGEIINYTLFWEKTKKNAEEIGNFVLNQWYHSPFKIDGIEYKTSAHWMMTQKAILFNDNETWYKILAADTQNEVKEYGCQIKGFNQLKWDERKYRIVKAGNIHKYRQNKKLKEYLTNTNNSVIVEASPKDEIWGIGLDRKSLSVTNPHEWKGLNLLGFALMEVRDFLTEFGDFDYMTGPMAPPDIKYPMFDSRSKFGGTGLDQQYLLDFNRYFNRLSIQEKIIYELIYPTWRRDDLTKNRMYAS